MSARMCYNTSDDPQDLGVFDAMDHAERAKQLFLDGYNCSQAVFCAFCDVTGLGMDAAARMASSFGGGLGRMREVCGTVSGAALVLGVVRGYADPKDYAAKKAHYALVQEFVRRFREENGSIICRELLRGVEVAPGGAPEARTPEYYKKRPCPNMAWSAAKILDDMLVEKDDA